MRHLRLVTMGVADMVAAELDEMQVEYSVRTYGKERLTLYDLGEIRIIIDSDAVHTKRQGVHCTLDVTDVVCTVYKAIESAERDGFDTIWVR